MLVSLPDSLIYLILSFYFENYQDLDAFCLVNTETNEMLRPYRESLRWRVARNIFKNTETTFKKHPELRDVYEKMANVKKIHFDFNMQNTQFLTIKESLLKRLALDIVWDKDLEPLKTLLMNKSLDVIVSSTTYSLLSISESYQRIYYPDHTKEFNSYLIDALKFIFRRRLNNDIEQNVDLWNVHLEYVRKHTILYGSTLGALKRGKRFSKRCSLFKVRSLEDFFVWRLLVYFPFRTDNPAIMLKLMGAELQDYKRIYELRIAILSLFEFILLASCNTGAVSAFTGDFMMFIAVILFEVISLLLFDVLR